jgi:hypothetical protein
MLDTSDALLAPARAPAGGAGAVTGPCRASVAGGGARACIRAGCTAGEAHDDAAVVATKRPICRPISAAPRLQQQLQHQARPRVAYEASSASGGVDGWSTGLVAGVKSLGSFACWVDGASEASGMEGAGTGDTGSAGVEKPRSAILSSNMKLLSSSAAMQLRHQPFAPELHTRLPAYLVAASAAARRAATTLTVNLSAQSSQ